MYLSLDPELELVGEASDGQAAVRLTRELRPDVVLMDLTPPRRGGRESICPVARLDGVSVDAAGRS